MPIQQRFCVALALVYGFALWSFVGVWWMEDVVDGPRRSGLESARRREQLAAMHERAMKRGQLPNSTPAVVFDEPLLNYMYAVKKKPPLAPTPRVFEQRDILLSGPPAPRVFEQQDILLSGPSKFNGMETRHSNASTLSRKGMRFDIADTAIARTIHLYYNKTKTDVKMDTPREGSKTGGGAVQFDVEKMIIATNKEKKAKYDESDTTIGRIVSRKSLLPRYAYVWCLGSSGNFKQYSEGIRVSVSILKSLQAHKVHITDDNCDPVEILNIDYVLLVKKDSTRDYVETIKAMSTLFDQVVFVSRMGPGGDFYADNYLKVMTLGLYDGASIEIPRGGYDKVLYLEADYVPLRSLTHLFFQTLSVHKPAPGPNPEFEAVTNSEKDALFHELQKAETFWTRCPTFHAQSWPLKQIQMGENDTNKEILAMPVAYWLQQPCYVSGGPILLRPSPKLFELYAQPLTHCNESKHPVFANAQTCGHAPKFKGICRETDMGYLNRIIFSRATNRVGDPYGVDMKPIVRTLHSFYTVLIGEFVFQPSPRSDIKGYFTRNFFGGDAQKTYQHLFGVHFAGQIKPWTSPPYHSFGVIMPEYHDVIRFWKRFATKTPSFH